MHTPIIIYMEYPLERPTPFIIYEEYPAISQKDFLKEKKPEILTLGFIEKPLQYLQLYSVFRNSGRPHPTTGGCSASLLRQENQDLCAQYHVVTSRRYLGTPYDE